MKDIYVRDLKPNQIITSSFLVHSKELRFRKTGEGYLAMALADKTGEVEAKMWEDVEQVHSTFAQDDFVKIKAAVQLYRNRPQLTVYKLRRLEDQEVDLADFFLRSARDPDGMWQELGQVVEGIQNPWLKTLLNKILSEPDVRERLPVAPAAKSLHHAFQGGLLEHILSLCRLCRLVVQNYNGLDLDLLLTGAVLHDIGKIHELSYARSFNYTTEGQLLGHMILELEIVHRAVTEIPDFPRPWQTLVEHLIISHHGEYEFGSPKLPMFPEALLLHYLDNMDSKIQGMQALLHREPAPDGEWVGFVPSLGRPLLNLQKYLQDSSPESPEPDSNTPGLPAEAETGVREE